MGSELQNIVLASNTSYDSLEDLESCLQESGKQVNRLFVADDKIYRSLWTKGKLGVLQLRFLMYVIYPIKLIFNILLSKPKSVFIVTSATFYAPLIASVFGKIKRIKVIYLLYDLFPEALHVESNKNKGLVYSLIGKITRLTIKSCDATVFLGDNLKEYTTIVWAKPKRSSVIDVGVNSKRFFLKELRRSPQQTTPIRYGGQLGRMHDPVPLSFYCDSVARHFSGKVKFDLYASGKGVAAFKTIENSHVILNSPRLDPNWRASLSEYPLGLISLNPYAGVVCLPSKIYSMLASGQAIIAIAPVWSDVARIIIDNDAGWVINNCECETLSDFIDYQNRNRGIRTDKNTVLENLTKTINFILENPDVLETKRRNARVAAENKYDLSVLSEKWSTLVNDVLLNEAK